MQVRGLVGVCDALCTLPIQKQTWLPVDPQSSTAADLTPSPTTLNQTHNNQGINTTGQRTWSAETAWPSPPTAQTPRPPSERRRGSFLTGTAAQRARCSRCTRCGSRGRTGPWFGLGAGGAVGCEELSIVDNSSSCGHPKAAVAARRQNPAANKPRT